MKDARQVELCQLLKCAADDIRSIADVMDQGKRQGEKIFARDMREFANLCSDWSDVYGRGIVK